MTGNEFAPQPASLLNSLLEGRPTPHACSIRTLVDEYEQRWRGCIPGEPVTPRREKGAMIFDLRSGSESHQDDMPGRRRFRQPGSDGLLFSVLDRLEHLYLEIAAERRGQE